MAGPYSSNLTATGTGCTATLAASSVGPSLDDVRLRLDAGSPPDGLRVERFVPGSMWSYELLHLSPTMMTSAQEVEVWSTTAFVRFSDPPTEFQYAYENSTNDLLLSSNLAGNLFRWRSGLSQVRFALAQKNIGANPDIALDFVSWNKYVGALPSSPAGLLKVVLPTPSFHGVLPALAAGASATDPSDGLSYQQAPPGAAGGYYVQFDESTSEVIVSFDTSRYPAGRAYRMLAFYTLP